MSDQKITLIDTHCHLDDSKFDKDRNLVIERAKESGISAVINIGTDQNTNAAAVALTQKHPGYIYHTIGAHPEQANVFDHKHTKKIMAQARDSEPLAIGEIGLDYFHDSDKTKQKNMFETMLEIAHDSDKPIVIHNREADDDMFAMLSEHASGLKILLHSYLSGPQYTEKFLDLGCYFGIGGPVTFISENADPHREAVALIPLERIMLETDAPYLTPHPNRGQRNEPSFIMFTAEKIAEIKKMDLNQIALQTTKNAKQFFGL